MDDVARLELLDLVDHALLERYPDLERLERRPRRDDDAFGARGVPGSLTARELDAWLYAPSVRVAFPVLLGDDAPLGPGTAQERWLRLMVEHLHLHGPGAGTEWTGLSTVAMPLLPPFDEAGLRVRPVLALSGDVSPDDASWLSEVMVATVRNGQAHVVPVQVFSAEAFHRALVNPAVDPALITLR